MSKLAYKLLISAELAFYFIAQLSLSQAQVIKDETLSTEVNSSSDNHNFTITGGRQAERNLFHSFREFSVPKGGSAVFNNAPEIQNIFSRVTGTSISNIDGWIKASGSANLFLINPNGIIFGPNAKLSIGGSFIASTAQQIVFEDGTLFSATDPQLEPLLTVKMPIGLQFRETAERIENRSIGNSLSSTANLQVQPSKTLAFVGGDILFTERGSLVAPGGRIELGSVASDSFVSLTPIVRGWALGYENVQNFQNIELSGQAFVSVSDRGLAVSSGDIRLSGRQILLTDESRMNVFNRGIASSGTIVLKASESVEVRNGSRIAANADSTGTGGGIKIETNRLLVVGNNSLIGTVANNLGKGGDLVVEASESVELNGNGGLSQLRTQSQGRGEAGALTVETQRIILRDGGQITSSTSGSGKAGNLSVVASESIEAIGQGMSGRNPVFSGLFSSSRGGDGGSISVSTGRLVVADGARLSVSANQGSTGQAGTLAINASELVEVRGGSSLLATSDSPKQAGEISISTPILSLTDHAQIAASTSGQGNAGNIEIQSAGFVSLDNSLISTEVKSGAIGQGGNIEIQTGFLNLNNGAQIISSTSGRGNAGNILVKDANSVSLANNSTISTEIGETGVANQPSKIEIQTRQLSLTDGSKITASTAGQGDAGNIIVPNADSVLLSNSTISTQSSSASKAGDVTINTRELNLQNGAEVSASTISSEAGNITLSGLDTLEVFNSLISVSTVDGKAGVLTVNAAESLQLLGEGGLVVEATGQGSAGNLTINSPQLTLQDSARISAKTVSGLGGDIVLQGLNSLKVLDDGEITASTQTGQAGNLSINANENAAESVELSNQNTRLAAQATERGGNAGSVTINTRELTVQDRAEISASNISGVSQNITLQGLNILKVNNGEISASTVDGQAGSLSVSAAESVQLSQDGRLTVEATGTGFSGNLTINTPQLTLQDGAKISAITNSGQGGDIRLQGLNSLQVTNGSEISASTQTGRAGDISVNATDAVLLSGEGGLSVEATAGGTAGSLTLKTEQLTIADGARVSVSSPDGKAGNIDITANSLSLNRGSITAETGVGRDEEGANINLQVSDLLKLENESLISATANGTANGGNINIDTKFLIASPPEGLRGSDITANSSSGQGGTINITAEGVFGLQIQDKPTPGNDITAFSELEPALNGTVTLNLPDIDPNRGITELPANIVDSTALIAQNPCKKGAESEFTVTGRGGLPASINEDLSNEAVQVNLVEPASTVGTEEQIQKPSLNTSKSQNPIMPAQGWVFNDKGEIVLTAYNPTVTEPQRLQEKSDTCPVPASTQ